MTRAAIPIDDPDDPRIALYRAVRERDVVGRGERFVAEGEVVVVRPDQHVAARLHRPDAATIRAAVARAFGETP